MEIKSGKAKDNSRKSGAAAQHKQNLRAEAKVRQETYAKIPLKEKIARAGTREKAKLLKKEGKNVTN